MEMNTKKLKKNVWKKYPTWKIVDITKVKKCKWALVKLWKDGKYLTVKGRW